MYPIVEVADDAADLTEQLGTKPKFWFESTDGINTLFKEGRAGTGEDWAEKVAAELAELIELPHAHYDLATWRDRCGVVSQTFVPEGGGLVHGNELIARRVDEYPEEEFYRVRQHTLGLVMEIVSNEDVQVPASFVATDGIRVGGDVFVGYLMLDAWIGNQDRHHENWGLIQDSEGSITLAPSYDHAASLGRNESDAARNDRLTTKDKGRSVSTYVARARSGFYASDGDSKPMLTLEAFREAAKERPLAAAYWLQRLDAVQEEQFEAIFESVPTDLLSDLGAQFAIEMLRLNKQRLLSTTEEME